MVSLGVGPRGSCGRSMAFAAKKVWIPAKTEQQACSDLKKIKHQHHISKTRRWTFWASPRRCSRARYSTAKARPTQAVAALREAVHRDDHLHYIHMPPSRHTLGATLMDAKRATRMPRASTATMSAPYPENGWGSMASRRGISPAGKTGKAPGTSRCVFDKAWQHADVKLKSSATCRGKTSLQRDCQPGGAGGLSASVLCIVSDHEVRQAVNCRQVRNSDLLIRLGPHRQLDHFQSRAVHDPRRTGLW